MAEHERQDWGTKWQLLVADAWSDQNLKKRLLQEPMTVLKERGIEPPKGTQIKVVEETENSMCFVLPQPPAEAELSEQQLQSVAGGQGCTGGCTGGCGGGCTGGCGCRGCTGGCGCGCGRGCCGRGCC
jgi:hypothetical protein